MFQWGIKSLTFSNDQSISIEPGSTLVIVGPNNSGKSEALRNIENRLVGQDRGSVIKELKKFCSGTEQEFERWLVKHFAIFGEGANQQYVTKGGNLHKNQISECWQEIQNLKSNNQTQHFMSRRLDTFSRLILANNTQAHPRNSPSANEYIHVLQIDEKLALDVSNLVRETFGVDLIINYGGGGQVWFHVGKQPDTKAGDRVSTAYLKELEKCPRLDNQGDGIKSFVGTLLALKCGAQPLLLIDEPEAFLHPPQIRRLGRIISESAETLARQIIIATHSGEIIEGLLGGSKKVAVCRLTRVDDVNYAQLLAHDAIQDLWSKPLLRSAAALDGIFHKGVIVTESDSDSRFYEAILRIIEEKQKSGALDYYFMHGHGKGSLATLTIPYRKLGVSVAVVADFDLLQKKGEFRKVFESLGGEFHEVESIYDCVSAILCDLSPLKSAPDFVAEVQDVLKQVEDAKSVTKNAKKQLSELLGEVGGWSKAKKYGLEKLSDPQNVQCSALLSICEKHGLFIVPQGALESWWRGGSSDKSDWFLDAIEKLSDCPTLFKSATDFMARIACFLSPKLANENETVS